MKRMLAAKAKNAKRGKPIPKKEAVVSLVERDGKVRSFHLPAVNHKNLRPVLVTQIDRKSYLMNEQQAHDYLGAKTDALQFNDKEQGKLEGMRQFLDEKSYRPGLGHFKRNKATGD